MMSPSYIISSLLLLTLFIHIYTKKKKKNPPHSIPAPLIGTTLSVRLCRYIRVYFSKKRREREKKTQTFNQMSSSGSNVHSLTASKAKKKGKEKPCLCDRPSNLNRPANDNCRDTLLTTDMGTGGKKEPITQHLVVPLPCFSTEKSGQSGTHTPVEVKSGTHTKQAKENRCLFIRVF